MDCFLFSQELESPNVQLLGNYCTGNLSNNLSLAFSSYDEGLYEVPTGVIVLLSIFYGSISVIAIVGNFLVMWIIASSRRMHNVTYYFIANLALADIMIGLFSIPFQFQAALLQRWNLPHFMCPFCPFVQILSVNVSIFTLTAIAVDRHRAVLSPLTARPSKFMAKVVIFGVWSLGTALAVPMAAALRVTNITEVDAVGRIHTRPFCQNVHFSDKGMMQYRLLLFFLQYALPLCVIIWAYTRMAHRLWQSKVPGNAEDARDANIMKNKKKVIKMLVIVVTLFGICWLPLQMYNVFQDIFPDINKYRYINILWFSFDWLAMSNSCYNPFIYGIYNEKFKREFHLRFPGLRSMHRSSAYNSESLDLDRTGQTILHMRGLRRDCDNLMLGRRCHGNNCWLAHQIQYTSGRIRSESPRNFRLRKYNEAKV